jgi:hypothetical protein
MQDGEPTGQPWLTQSTPTIAEARPLIEPTERSISPSISTQTMPSEMTPTVAQSNSRFTRLFGARNIGLSAENTMEMTTRPTATGSMPRSPERTRSTKPRMAPPSPRRGDALVGCGRAGLEAGHASPPGKAPRHDLPSGCGARRNCRWRR